MLKKTGILVLTFDVSLDGRGEIVLEKAANLIRFLRFHFEERDVNAPWKRLVEESPVDPSDQSSIVADWQTVWEQQVVGFRNDPEGT